MKEVLIYIVIIMIFYDFSLHLLEYLLGIEKARKIKYYWPNFSYSEGKFNRRFYTIFWAIYWLTALILLIIYIIYEV